MNENYNVSNMEIRQYLANKRIAHQKAIEQIDAALTLFEEAEGELSKSKIDVSINLEHKREEILKIIDITKEVSIGVGKLPKKFQSFDSNDIEKGGEGDKTVSSMTAEKFIESIKILRIQANKNQKEMGTVLGIGQKGYSYFEDKVINNKVITSATILRLIKLAKFFNISLPEEFLAGGWCKSPIKPKRFRGTKSICVKTTNISTVGVPIKRVYKKRDREPAPDDSSA